MNYLFEGRHVLAQGIFVGARHQAIMSVQRPCTQPELRIRIHRIHMFLSLPDPDPDP